MKIHFDLVGMRLGVGCYAQSYPIQRPLLKSGSLRLRTGAVTNKKHNHHQSLFVMDSKEQLLVLEEIRELIKAQGKTQARLLEIQQEHIELYRNQLNRVERINSKAEAIQDKSAQLMGTARKGVAVALAIVIALVAYLSWLLFM